MVRLGEICTCIEKNMLKKWSSPCGSAVMSPTRIHVDTGSIPGLLARWLRIQCCRELWCGLRTQLGSCIAGIQTGSYSSDSTPSLRTFICYRCGPKKLKSEKEKKEESEFCGYSLQIFKNFKCNRCTQSQNYIFFKIFK